MRTGKSSHYLRMSNLRGGIVVTSILPASSPTSLTGLTYWPPHQPPYQPSPTLLTSLHQPHLPASTNLAYQPSHQPIPHLPYILYLCSSIIHCPTTLSIILQSLLLPSSLTCYYIISVFTTCQSLLMSHSATSSC